MKPFRITILTTVLLFFTVQITTAQYRNFLDTIPKFEVINPQIYQALDTVLLCTKDCIFSILDRPYHFRIDLWRTTKQKVTVIITATTYYGNLNKETLIRKGFFYYKDYLVLVRDLSGYLEKAAYPLFFEKTDSIQALYFIEYSDYPNRSKGVETASIDYQYQYGILEEEKRDICREYPYYVYKIKDNDTWESIAKKLRTTVEELQSIQEVYGEDLPPVGSGIRFMYYKTGDGRMRIEGSWSNVLPGRGVIEKEKSKKQ